MINSVQDNQMQPPIAVYNPSNTAPISQFTYDYRTEAFPNVAPTAPALASPQEYNQQPQQYNRSPQEYNQQPAYYQPPQQRF